MEVKVFLVSNGKMKNQCYLIYDHQMGILIDPAWDYELINNFLLENQIILKGILLTHSHPDHVNLAPIFAADYGVPVYMSAAEIEAYNFSCLNLVPVQHLEEIVIGDFVINPLVTPGHTLGSTCYQIGSHCFTGDTVFIEGVGECKSIKAAELLFDSIQFFRNYLPKYALIWPGHSFGITTGKDMDYLLSNNLYFQIDQKEMFISFRMRKNRPNPLAFH
ncbi:MBL fold metallo-hydrolase [Pedobacter sp. PAMC26386]|nr:MBL fold metallo-hydrolase [Pedobacter sp. PAMC26386]